MRCSAALLVLAIGAAGLIEGCDFGDGKSDDSRAAETDTTARKTKVPAGIAGPTAVDESGDFAAKAVEKVYGREVSQGQATVVGASCTSGNCIVRYRSQARGAGQVVSDQDRILRPLFARRSVRSVILYVHHWQTGTKAKNEAPVFATTTCRRSEHPSFNWADIQAADVERVCKYVHRAGGQVRSEVRRGIVSNKEASQGRGGGKGGGNQAGGR